MENIIAHLEAAKDNVSFGLAALGVSVNEGGHHTDFSQGPNSDLPHYAPEGFVPSGEAYSDPEGILPTETRIGSSDNLGPSDGSGHDNIYREDEIVSFGEEDDGEAMIDSVQVYEYDLGQYSDAVTSVDLSAIPGDAELNFLGYDANGAAIVSIGEDGVVVTLEGEAAAYIAQLNYGAEVGPLGVSVEALVGASASGSASLKINPFEGDFELEVQAGVVVGATIDANGELQLGHVTIEGGATGVAGLAAEVELDVGFDDWKFEADVGGKLAFLLGGGFDVSFAVDGKEIAADFGDAGKVIWNDSGEIVGGVLDLGGETVEFAADGVEWVGGVLQNIGSGIGDAVDRGTPWGGLLPGV